MTDELSSEEKQVLPRKRADRTLRAFPRLQRSSTPPLLPMATSSERP